LSTIAGYAELMNYRNLPLGSAAVQADSTAQQPTVCSSSADVLPELRGIMDSFKRAGSRLSDDELQDTLDDMVLSGQITDDQADEIFAGLQRAKESMPGAAVMKGLSMLTASGTITAEQRDAAAQAISGAGDGLQELVDDGMLSQDQMDAVMESCRSAVKLRQARQAYGLMLANPLARAAYAGSGKNYAILDAYEQSLAAGVSA
jgi:polyhydroxyalkanoate synthesis regulator phasin